MRGNLSGNALRTWRWLVPVAGVVWLVGCATTPEEDPVLQGKLSDLDSRTQNIERVVQNQNLLSLAQRADQLVGAARNPRTFTRVVDGQGGGHRDRGRRLGRRYAVDAYPAGADQLRRLFA